MTRDGWVHSNTKNPHRDRGRPCLTLDITQCTIFICADAACVPLQNYSRLIDLTIQSQTTAPVALKQPDPSVPSQQGLPTIALSRIRLTCAGGAFVRLAAVHEVPAQPGEPGRNVSCFFHMCNTRLVWRTGDLLLLETSCILAELISGTPHDKTTATPTAAAQRVTLVLVTKDSGSKRGHCHINQTTVTCEGC
jgi:hypothetical protein